MLTLILGNKNHVTLTNWSFKRIIDLGRILMLQTVVSSGGVKFFYIVCSPGTYCGYLLRALGLVLASGRLADQRSTYYNLLWDSKAEAKFYHKPLPYFTSKVGRIN